MERAATHTPLVLLHGFAQSPASWNEVACDLKQAGYAVLTPPIGCASEAYAPVDLPAATLDALASELLDVLDDAGIDRVDLVGYSMGGRVALTFALAHPERLSSLVLESAGVGLRGEAERAAAAARDAVLAERLRTERIEAFVDYWEELPIFATQKELPPEQRARVRAERCACDPHGLALLVEAAGQHTMPDLRPRLCEITVPMLYLAGQRDVRYRMLSEELETTYGVTVQRFDTGHDIHLEDHAAFVAALCRFYAENDRRS
jgi:2-succinyl-6-hydroxy-2,4-cyclohexadiene-1-carboxylate synthase